MHQSQAVAGASAPSLRAATAGVGACGFTLVEALVALTVVLLALTMSVAFLAQQPRLLSRLEAQAAADRVLEATLESLRAGQVKLESGPPVWSVAPPAEATREQIAIELDVAPEGTPDLYLVTVSAHYELEGRPRRRAATTMVWQP